MEELFSIMIEQLQRGSWMKRKKDDDRATDEEIYSLGAKHTCLLTNNSTNTTDSVKIEQDKIELVEMSENGIAGYRYSLKKISPRQTLFLIEMRVKNNPVLKLGFSIVFKSSMKKKVHRFFESLENFIKGNKLIENEA